MKNVSPFGIALMQLYKNAVRSNPAIEVDRTYLVAVNVEGDVTGCWVDNCNNHEEALGRCMGGLATKNDGAEYAVIGPCRSECACGRVRGKTYFTSQR